MDNHEPPQPRAGDRVHALVKGAIGAVPIVGGVAAEAFALAVSPPLQRRQQKWMEEVGEALLGLERRIEGFRVDALQNKESFVTVAVQATASALRNHSDEKRAALRNAVLNAALASDPDEDEQMMFLHVIDRLTPTHLQILLFMSNPVAAFVGRRPPQYSVGSVESVLEQAVPQLAGRREFYRLLVRELYDVGFTTRSELSGMQTGGSLYERTTNDRGDRFLKFIREPTP